MNCLTLFLRKNFMLIYWLTGNATYMHVVVCLCVICHYWMCFWLYKYSAICNYMLFYPIMLSSMFSTNSHFYNDILKKKIRNFQFQNPCNNFTKDDWDLTGDQYWGAPLSDNNLKVVIALLFCRIPLAYIFILAAKPT